jgi:hypothetical protein
LCTSCELTTNIVVKRHRYQLFRVHQERGVLWREFGKNLFDKPIGVLVGREPMNEINRKASSIAP